MPERTAPFVRSPERQVRWRASCANPSVADWRQLAFAKLLPADEAAHVVSAATNEAGELVLVMDTPSWAARVRYCLRALPGGADVKISRFAARRLSSRPAARSETRASVARCELI